MFTGSRHGVFCVPEVLWRLLDFLAKRTTDEDRRDRANREQPPKSIRTIRRHHINDRGRRKNKGKSRRWRKRKMKKNRGCLNTLCCVEDGRLQLVLEDDKETLKIVSIRGTDLFAAWFLSRILFLAAPRLDHRVFPAGRKFPRKKALSLDPLRDRTPWHRSSIVYLLTIPNAFPYDLRASKGICEFLSNIRKEFYAIILYDL